MSVQTGKQELQIRLAPDNMQAELVVPAGFPRELLTAAACQSLLQQYGVEITPEVSAALADLIDRAAVEVGECRGVVAQAAPPQHGQDGRIDWLVDQTRAEHDRDANYYDRSAYIMVQTRQVLGQLFEPTLGQDGRDICGRTIPARPGKPAHLKLDESILRNGNQQLVAQQNGMLCREGERVTIRKLLEVRDYVDFSTGNIDFVGDVHIGKGVRDSFVVKAGGRIEVRGLIEAATIECGGDLVAAGGIAGHTRGSVAVGGNLVTRYLDNVQGQVKGDLLLEREAINCQLTIDGAVRASEGQILGGCVCVVGRLDIGVVGSPAGVTTELVLGSVPALEPLALKLRQLLEELTAKRDLFQAEFDQTNHGTRRLTAQDKERQTELMFNLQVIQEKMARGQVALDGLLVRIQQQRTVDAHVHRLLHAGTWVTVGERSFRVHTDLQGPVRILRDQIGDIVYRSATGAGGLFAQIAEVKVRAL